MDTDKDTMVQEFEQPNDIRTGEKPQSNGNLTPEDSATKAQRLFNDMRDMSIATGKTVKLREIGGKPIIGLVPKPEIKDEDIESTQPATHPPEDVGYLDLKRMANNSGLTFVHPGSEGPKIKIFPSNIAPAQGLDVKTSPQGPTQPSGPEVSTVE